MENFSIECLACGKAVGEGTRADAVVRAVHHLQQHHRSVAMPHPALSLIRLHPYYTLDVLQEARIDDAAAANPDTVSDQPSAPADSGAATGGAPQNPALTLN